jgi:AraC-like DNA-binding protein
MLINVMFLRQITIPAAAPLPPSSDEQDKPKNDLQESDKKLAENLINRTREESLFQIPNLTLARLAETFEISEKYCSELLNHHLETNFSDFINRLRVEACQRALIEKHDINVLEIGFEFGFNSKTAFNTAFKKFTGQTPTQFRKSERSDIRFN